MSTEGFFHPASLLLPQQQFPKTKLRTQELLNSVAVSQGEAQGTWCHKGYGRQSQSRAVKVAEVAGLAHGLCKLGLFTFWPHLPSLSPQCRLGSAWPEHRSSVQCPSQGLGTRGPLTGSPRLRRPT